MLRARSLYPDLIGRKSDDIKPAFEGSKLKTLGWMKCDCGMVVMTTPDLHGQSTVCANCKQHQHDAVDGIGVFAAPRSTTLSKKSERRILFGLVVLVILLFATMGMRVADAPPRAHADDRVQLD